MRFLDTNVFLRYLTRDDDIKAQACLDLLRRVANGTEEVTTCEAVICEIVYMLSSRGVYKLRHDEVSALLRPLLSLRSLRLPRKRVYARALDLYAVSPFLDFEDALSVAHMERQGIEEIVSYDADFDRIPSVRRIEP